ncbi:unnamed protein product [Lactuca saligna]|uniref:Bulb-type lectin domain-containing protein n=1 Tax=Lactuca saligna TaxID=75948 RepID=A0AA35ZZZ1_LACSI|nr:unnamed protein product [Lactuca saligna]
MYLSFWNLLIYLSTTWINDESSNPSSTSSDATSVTVILLENYSSSSYGFTCGFFCNGAYTIYLFAILLNQYDPRVIWSANRDNPVSKGAILNFTAAGELVLQDADGSIVWTTNTTGKSVAGMKLNDNGNLVLFDSHNSMVWQSFDHPTECLVKGKKLYQLQKLIPSEDMQSHGIEVTEMMKVASWCLQTDFTRRPSMSYVVKVLEGVMNIESNLDYNFLDPRVQKTAIDHEKISKPMSPSILSGPRTIKVKLMNAFPSKRYPSLYVGRSGSGLVALMHIL